jgi:hypothetical protein
MMADGYNNDDNNEFTTGERMLVRVAFPRTDF